MFSFSRGYACQVDFQDQDNDHEAEGMDTGVDFLHLAEICGARTSPGLKEIIKAVEEGNSCCEAPRGLACQSAA